MPNSDDLLTDPLLQSVPVYEGYKVLGRVALYQKLAQGPTGAVYKGRHLTLNVDVAVKVMGPPAGADSEESERLVRSSVRAMRAAATVKHDNLARVYGVEEENGLRFVVMPFIDGESAADRLRRRGKISEEEAAEICKAAASGIAAAHKRGMVHQDVRPDRIFIDKEGKVFVTGLGLGGRSDLTGRPGREERKRRLPAREGAGPHRESSPQAAPAGQRRASEPRTPRRPASFGPSPADVARSGGRQGKDRKEMYSFIQRNVLSLAHQVVLTYLARRGPGPADPREVAQQLDLKASEVRDVLEDWRQRGFVNSSGPHRYYYVPSQKEKETIIAFLRDWADPEEHKRLMAMILRMEKR